ncbi:MAG: hypothetical protein ACYC6D_03035, partial [Melioribacteraceae bacterium]
MKKLTVLILLILFTGLLYLAENEPSFIQKNSSALTNDYNNGILKSEQTKVDKRANYNLDVDFDADAKKIFVKENIIWINKTNSPTSEIQFHFYANGYKSSKTLFAKAFPINSETQTETDVKTFLVNGKSSELIYFQPEIENQHDSTVARVILDKPVQPGDSVKIFFDYSMKIPRSVKRMGYASGRNFFFVSQWFPKVGVFENG